MIAIVLGTSAEFLRCIPLVKSLQRHEVDFNLLLTGQNKIDDLVKEFDIHSDNFIRLRAFEGVSTNLIKGFKQTPALTLEIRQILKAIKPSHVVCHGDTLTAVTATLASSGLYKIAHIEAGFRSHSIFEPFPEEMFRIIVDHKSDFLYAPSKLSTENLLRERVRGEILTTGSTVPDVVNTALEMIGKTSQSEEFVVVTAHRYENIFIRSRLKRIINILSLPRMPIYWPIHEITEGQLKRFGLLGEVRKMGIHILPPLSYVKFMELLSNCNYVITDGGSIEEESIILKKPCLLLRKRTERIEGLRTGLTFLTKRDVKLSGRIISRIEASGPVIRDVKNPFITSESATRLIANHLITQVGGI